MGANFRRFPQKTETRGRKPLNLRQTVNGIFYLLRTGIPWRDLPERYSRFPARAWCADRAYVDVDIRRFIERYGAEYVVPPKKNTKNRWEYDRGVYRTRHLIENCFQQLKEFRRIATRYEKRSRHFASMVSLASIMIHLF